MDTINYQITELENGLRIITEHISHVKSMSMGIWIGVGSRYENEKNNGITHFIEHMLFKGTTNRSAKDIAEEMDAVGGQLNAFTSKECTCYYVKALDEHFDLSADMLADMLLNSLFDPNEINKERDVIIEEIKMYEDTPDDLIQDLFAATMWPNNPLGRSILGTEETLASFDQALLKDYLAKYYTGENMVISVVGNIDHEQVIGKLTPLFSHLPRGTIQKKEVPGMYQAMTECFKKDIGQAQICIGVPGVANLDDDLYPISILNVILGGGLSSNLVQKIREELGLAYSVYSYHGAYSDTGAFVFSAATRPENCQQVVDLIIDEAQKIAQNGITEKQLQRALNQLKGNLYMGLESISSRMNKLGRSLLSYDRVFTPEETVALLEKVTVEDVLAMAQRLFKKENFTLVVLGPVEEITIP